MRELGVIKGVLDWARRKLFSTTFLKFGIVGASGVVVNHGIAYLGYIAGLSDIISIVGPTTEVRHVEGSAPMYRASYFPHSTPKFT